MLGRHRSRASLIVALLAASLAVTGLLAYQALQAGRSHRATAENVLRDYAKFAAWELGRLSRQQLMNVMNPELTRVQTAVARGDLGGAFRFTCAPTCDAGHHFFLTVFRVTLSDLRVTSAGAPLDDGIRQTLVREGADLLKPTTAVCCPVLSIVGGGNDRVVLVWRPMYDGGESPAGIVGFVAGMPFVTHTLEKLLRTTSLLPPSLVPSGTDAKSVLSVRVSAADGKEIFASGAGWSDYQASDALTPDLGALRLAVALQPQAATRLVIGGLPRDRLPLVIALLTITAGLVVVALVQLRREAELSRLRSDFVSGVSHELRTPLAQIRMFTETLLLGRVRSPHESRRSLEIIVREAQRLMQLVENVLMFSRGERRRPELARGTARLAAIVREIVESFAPLAAARGARIVTVLDETIAANVDAGAVRQIVLNLLDNAVKYGPTGQTVTVRLRLADARAELSVEDEGPGVAASDADRIWLAFNRIERPDAAVGGAGIGLAIVRQLTELHGGRARVERGPVGARFLVEFPGASADAPAATAVA